MKQFYVLVPKYRGHTWAGYSHRITGVLDFAKERADKMQKYLGNIMLFADITVEVQDDKSNVLYISEPPPWR